MIRFRLEYAVNKTWREISTHDTEQLAEAALAENRDLDRMPPKEHYSYRIRPFNEEREYAKGS